MVSNHSLHQHNIVTHVHSILVVILFQIPLLHALKVATFSPTSPQPNVLSQRLKTAHSVNASQMQLHNPLARKDLLCRLDILVLFSFQGHRMGHSLHYLKLWRLITSSFLRVVSPTKGHCTSFHYKLSRSLSGWSLVIKEAGRTFSLPSYHCLHSIWVGRVWKKWKELPDNLYRLAFLPS